MANNEKSAALGAGGAIIGIIGGILCFVGKHMDRDLERQFSSVWNTGSRDETGDIFFFIGVALVIIGVLMIVVNIFQYYQPSTSADNSTNQNSDEIVSDFWDCPKCGAINSKYRRFCDCGESKPVDNKKTIINNDIGNSWRCYKCGKVNLNYVGTCGCGVTKEENNKRNIFSEESEIVVCPICAARVELGMFTCPNCNQRIDWSKIASEKTKEVINVQHKTNEEQRKNFCTKCGAKLVVGNIFCGSCGVKIE